VNNGVARSVETTPAGTWITSHPDLRLQSTSLSLGSACSPPAESRCDACVCWSPKMTSPVTMAVTVLLSYHTLVVYPHLELISPHPPARWRDAANLRLSTLLRDPVRIRYLVEQVRLGGSQIQNAPGLSSRRRRLRLRLKLTTDSPK
jgi:hypothetical protein